MERHVDSKKDCSDSHGSATQNLKLKQQIEDRRDTLKIQGDRGRMMNLQD